jgi:cytochrome P450
MSNDPKEAIKGAMGIETETYNKFESTMDRLKGIVMEKLEAFIAKYERGELDENERNSYFAHAIQRQRSEDSDIDEFELMQVALIMLNASVDTTSAFINWAMVHLSTNPDVQEKLYQELKQHVDASEDGTLSADMLTKSKSPYLHAVLRESHRMTPVYPATMFKSNSVDDIELHGVTVPKGSLVGFDPYPIGMDPDIVNEPHKFQPERWLGDEPVQKRKGTAAEVLDSVMYRDPFSQGARRCPGSRVAVNETQLILSQLVLDWKITAPTSVKSYKDVEYTMKTLLVAHLPEMTVEARVL